MLLALIPLTPVRLFGSSVACAHPVSDVIGPCGRLTPVLPEFLLKIDEGNLQTNSKESKELGVVGKAWQTVFSGLGE